MKNIHLLRTRDTSVLSMAYLANPVYLRYKKLGFKYDAFGSNDNRHMYITSDKDPKLDEWGINLKNNVVFKCKGFSPTKETKEYHKKIILTTDQYLIKDGVQAINDEFLEWFVKNPNYKEVKVKPLLSNNGRALFGYKIIIPKEEPKYTLIKESCIQCDGTGETTTSQTYNSQRVCNLCNGKKYLGKQILIQKPKQETFEEATEKYKNYYEVNAFNEGAKLQQERNYSEEDMHKLMDEYQDYLFKTNEPVKTFKEWFEQFKK